MRKLYADLVVIGGGAAGMPAALEAMEQGVKSVILLDRLPFPGGNARMAGGYVFAADSYTQEEAGTVLHKEDAYKEAMAYSHGQNINPRILRAFIDRSADNLDWLRKKGIEYFDTQFMGNGIVGAGAPGSYAKVIDKLKEDFLALGGQVLGNTPAKEILLDENGHVSGVLARENKGDEILIHTQYVMLSPGGFMGNAMLMERFFADEYDESAYVTDAIKYPGDGISMAEQAGAKLSSHATLVKESGYSFGGKKNRPHRIGMLSGAIWVNAEGRRFCDESTGADHNNPNLLVQQPGMIGYALFDSDCLNHLIAHPTPQVNNMFLEPGDPLVRTQLEEAQAQTPELCCIADTWEEIARWLEVESGVLQHTIEEYNAGCTAQYDSIFAKPKEHLRPLTKAPFYAVKFSPLMVETIGPVVINEHFQVLRKADNRPIPGLYAGGAITSGWQGHDYAMWGGNLGYGLSSGRIAADHIAASIQEKGAKNA